MNFAEVIFALLVILSFSVFLFHAEKSLLEKSVQAGESLGRKHDTTLCSAAANFYYAAAGGKLWKALSCSTPELSLVSTDAGTLETASGKKLAVKTEAHYA